MHVTIGTYSARGSKGIYVLDLDAATGHLRDTGHAAPAQNPSFVAFHPSGRFLYAVNEVGEVNGKPGGGVSAFAVDAATGALTFINQQSSLGGAPCHLAVDPSGSLVAIANYSGGSVVSLPINADGSLGEASAFFAHEGSSVDKGRQGEPHAHSVTFDGAGRFALVCDLGMDKIVIYEADAPGKRLRVGQVLAAATRPGSGPRHFAFHPSNRVGYVANELDSTLSTFAFDAPSGELREVQVLPTLPEGFAGQNYPADIHVLPSGRFVYASNRGHDSLAMYAVDAETGHLSVVGHEPTGGHTPRGFGIDPTGRFLLAANQESDSIVAFRIDTETGRLSATGQKIEVPSPVCVTFGAA